MCGSCISKVKPKLDANAEVKEWSVDTANKEKTLTVTLEDGASAELVIATVRSAGFTATEIQA